MAELNIQSKPVVSGGDTGRGGDRYFRSKAARDMVAAGRKVNVNGATGYAAEVTEIVGSPDGVLVFVPNASFESLNA